MVGVLVIDKEDGDFIFKVVYEGIIDIIKVGIYEIIYSVRDFVGNEVNVI